MNTVIYPEVGGTYRLSNGKVVNIVKQSVSGGWTYKKVLADGRTTQKTWHGFLGDPDFTIEDRLDSKKYQPYDVWTLQGRTLLKNGIPAIVMTPPYAADPALSPSRFDDTVRLINDLLNIHEDSKPKAKKV